MLHIMFIYSKMLHFKNLLDIK